MELPLTEITWDAQAVEKGGYQHFMLKEIHEQPAAVRDTLNSLLKDGQIDLSGAGLTEEVLQSVSSIHIAACGSAWPVGVAAHSSSVSFPRARASRTARAYMAMSWAL